MHALGWARRSQLDRRNSDVIRGAELTIPTCREDGYFAIRALDAPRFAPGIKARTISIEGACGDEFLHSRARPLVMINPPGLDGAANRARIRGRGLDLRVTPILERGHSDTTSNERHDRDDDQHLDECDAPHSRAPHDVKRWLHHVAV